MFGIGGMEVVLILVVALLVLGPDHLPRVMRMLGKTVGELRRASTEFQRTMNTEAARDETAGDEIADADKAARRTIAPHPLPLPEETPAAVSAAPASAPVARRVRKAPAPRIRRVQKPDPRPEPSAAAQAAAPAAEAAPPPETPPAPGRAPASRAASRSRAALRPARRSPRSAARERQ